MNQNLLILLTKFPTPGNVKTRLIPALGPQEACRVYDLMVKHVLSQVQSKHWDLEISYDGSTAAQMLDWLGPQLYTQQSGGGLGERIHGAFLQGFARGYQSICVIGCDIPGLNHTHIEQAFAGLLTADLSLGPTEDGGYYLIGLNQAQPKLFADIPWSTAIVFDTTLNQAQQENLSVHIGVPLQDIDEPKDLAHLSLFIQ